jgi:hypothetical protein
MVHVIVKRLTWRSAGKAANFFVSYSATIRACRKSGQQVMQGQPHEPPLVPYRNRNNHRPVTAAGTAADGRRTAVPPDHHQPDRGLARSGDGEAAFDFASPYLQMRFRTG